MSYVKIGCKEENFASSLSPEDPSAKEALRNPMVILPPELISLFFLHNKELFQDSIMSSKDVTPRKVNVGDDTSEQLLFDVLTRRAKSSRKTTKRKLSFCCDDRSSKSHKTLSTSLTEKKNNEKVEPMALNLLKSKNDKDPKSKSKNSRTKKDKIQCNFELTDSESIFEPVNRHSIALKRSTSKNDDSSKIITPGKSNLELTKNSLGAVSTIDNKRIQNCTDDSPSKNYGSYNGKEKKIKKRRESSCKNTKNKEKPNEIIQTINSRKDINKISLIAKNVEETTDDLLKEMKRKKKDNKSIHNSSELLVQMVSDQMVSDILPSVFLLDKNQSENIDKKSNIDLKKGKVCIADITSTHFKNKDINQFECEENFAGDENNDQDGKYIDELNEIKDKNNNEAKNIFRKLKAPSPKSLPENNVNMTIVKDFKFLQLTKPQHNHYIKVFGKNITPPSTYCKSEFYGDQQSSSSGVSQKNNCSLAVRDPTSNNGNAFSKYAGQKANEIIRSNNVWSRRECSRSNKVAPDVGIAASNGTENILFEKLCLEAPKVNIEPVFNTFESFAKLERMEMCSTPKEILGRTNPVSCPSDGTVMFYKGMEYKVTNNAKVCIPIYNPLKFLNKDVPKPLLLTPKENGATFPAQPFCISNFDIHNFN